MVAFCELLVKINQRIEGCGWRTDRYIKPLGKRNLFPSLQQHHFDTTLDVEDHVLRLIKEICGAVGLHEATSICYGNSNN
jgi:hypothetical protein